MAASQAPLPPAHRRDLLETVTQGTVTNILSAKTVGKATQNYYFTSVITPSSSSTAFQPTANVQFFDACANCSPSYGATSLGSAPLYSISSGNGGYALYAANLSTNSLPVGTHTITATYIGDANYPATTSAAQTVFAGGTPTLSWTTPSAIAYGTALSATQLNATNNIPGTFVYTPAAGAVLPPGNQPLSVTFTPADYSDFGPQTTGVTLAVNKGATSINVTAVSPASEAFAQDAPAMITAVLSWSGVGVAPTSSGVIISGNGAGTYGTTSCGAAVGTTITCSATYTPSASDMPGTFTETAVFPGDSNYSGSSSSQTNNFAITAASSTTTVGTSGTPSTYGQSVTLTAIINGQFGQVLGRGGRAKSNVSGSVTWSANTGCSSSPVSGNPGTATCVTSVLPGGNDTVTATYSGDSDHTGSSGTLAGGQTVSQASTSISVTSVSPSSEGFGQDTAATITAVVAWSDNGAAPTASNVAIGGNGNGAYGLTTCGAPSGDTMSCSATYTPNASDVPGSYTESASFSGDTNYTSSSSSQSNNFSIASASTTTSVGTSGTPTFFGQPVTFTATITAQYGLVKGRKERVKPQQVSGTVTWSPNTGCSPSTVTVGDPGTATCTTSTLPVGTDTIMATYAGDSEHTGSAGTLPGGQTIQGGAATSINVTSVNPSAEVYGQDAPVMITAVLTWSGAGTPPTASNVTISGNGSGIYGATSCGSPSGDTMTCTATYSPCGSDGAGNYTEAASFSGDSNYAPSSSSQTNNFAITTATTMTSVGTSGSPTTYGQSVTFTATINGQYGQVKGRGGWVKRNVSGSVTWSANTGCSASAVTGNPGTASCTTTSLGAGTDTITATYSGDSSHSGSAGTLAGGQVVNKATPTVTFTGLPGNAPYNMVYTLTATTNSSSTAMLTDSTPTVCTLAGTTVTIIKDGGACKVTANWAADANYTSATLMQTASAVKGIVNITWPTPAPIAYGTALSATQLDATANPTGTMTYTPGVGHIDVAGNNTLSVSVHPSNLNYGVTTKQVTLQVLPAPTTTTVTTGSESVILGVGNTPVKVTVTYNIGSYKPLGTVTLTASSGETCSGTVTAATGNGSCKLTFANMGARTIAAVYSGDANHTGSDNSSQSPAVTITVNPH